MAEVVAPSRPAPLPLWQALQIRDEVRRLGRDIRYGETRRPNREEIAGSAAESMRHAEYQRRFLEARAVGTWLACPWGAPEAPEED